MSVYREYTPLDEEDRVTVKDEQIIKKLLKTKKLTERQRLAIQRLLRTYNHIMD